MPSGRSVVWRGKSTSPSGRTGSTRTFAWTKDREELLAFFYYPADHWARLRTTNPIESTFATIRLRTKKTKGHGSRKAALAMAFKLAQSASKRWRSLNGSEMLPQVLQGISFVNGVRANDAAA